MGRSSSGTCLFWGNQQPHWMWDLTPAEAAGGNPRVAQCHRAQNSRTSKQIEVVNEPLHDLPDKVSAGNTTATGGSGGYYEALGGAGVTGHDWIINAFTLARRVLPERQADAQ